MHLFLQLISCRKVALSFVKLEHVPVMYPDSPAQTASFFQLLYHTSYVLYLLNISAYFCSSVLFYVKRMPGDKSDILFAVNLCLFAAILINNTFERFAIEMMQFICYPATIIRLCVYPETDPPLLLHSIYLR